MMNIKKRLSILIEDQPFDEDEIFSHLIKKESEAIFLSIDSDTYIDLLEKILDLNNSIIRQVASYMENKHYESDLSYIWLTRNNTLGLINKCISASKNSLKDCLAKRDLMSEFKLVKLLTEDNKHKENLVSLPKKVLKTNRYYDMLPCNSFFNLDKYNVATVDEQSVTEENYINASYIDGPLLEDSKLFIATQGPSSQTFSKFWKMIFNNDTKLIVMLCKLEEDIRKNCDKYWPEEKTMYDDVEVSLEKEQKIINNALIKREFRIQYEGVVKTVTHLQVINWLDHSLPEDSSVIETVIAYINNYRDNYLCPITVHCSAGVGRTGTLIAIYNLCKCLDLQLRYKHLHGIKMFFSVFNVVRKLREQRMGMVSSYVQYKYIYDYVVEYLGSLNN